MVLDTCAAAAFAQRYKLRTLPGDAVRAIDKLRDRTGFHILMGSAADSVSYEANDYGQGLLTYALLQGMRGAALAPGGEVDVQMIFQYAANRVPALARDIGSGIQKPEIKVPRGGLSFPFGLLSVEARRNIPLAGTKPVILRPVIQGEKGGDPLKLRTRFGEALREASYPASRGGAARLIYIEVDDIPDAFIPYGRYSVSGTNIQVTIALELALPIPTGSGGVAVAAPLITEHEIINSPSSSTLALLRSEAGSRRPATKTLAVLADPVFERSDERLKPSGGSNATGQVGACAGTNRRFGQVIGAAAKQAGVLRNGQCIERLPGTRREAEEIVRLVAPGQAHLSLGFAANRATATSSELSDYRYVHFATHGFLSNERPAELSGIVLSLFDEKGVPQDGFLRVRDIYTLKLAADVVVLSACETGLGKELGGEGLIGLTRGFMYAGAPRVVAGMWNVDDGETAELMTRFYRGMLVDKLRPSKALQVAQVSMLKEKQFAPSFNWAAFIMQGEWR